MTYKHFLAPQATPTENDDILMKKKYPKKKDTMSPPCSRNKIQPRGVSCPPLYIFCVGYGWHTAIYVYIYIYIYTRVERALRANIGPWALPWALACALP